MIRTITLMTPVKSTRDYSDTTQIDHQKVLGAKLPQLVHIRLLASHLMICLHPLNSVNQRNSRSDLTHSTLQICDYCYEDYMEKGGYNDYNDPTFTNSKKIQCVYCWSRHTLTDMQESKWKITGVNGTNLFVQMRKNLEISGIHASQRWKQNLDLVTNTR